MMAIEWRGTEEQEKVVDVYSKSLFLVLSASLMYSVDEAEEMRRDAVQDETARAHTNGSEESDVPVTAGSFAVPVLW